MARIIWNPQGQTGISVNSSFLNAFRTKYMSIPQDTQSPFIMVLNTMWHTSGRNSRRIWGQVKLFQTWLLLNTKEVRGDKQKWAIKISDNLASTWGIKRQDGCWLNYQPIVPWKITTYLFNNCALNAIYIFGILEALKIKIYIRCVPKVLQPIIQWKKQNQKQNHDSVITMVSLPTQGTV